uniref:G domain-containing protein n=1 Tax=Strombidinopsis acuminata TaxID=141414 RepID=A0A7S3U2M3_9SPIT
MGEQACKQKQRDTLFSTIEDFGRADPSLKRLLVIGCTGAGKSTLLNLLAGWTYVGDGDAEELDFAWVAKPEAEEAETTGAPNVAVNADAPNATADDDLADACDDTSPTTSAETAPDAPAARTAEPLFKTASGGDSVTKKSAYANLCWFGDESKPFTAIDTPGHDDPDGADIDSPEAREALGEMAADLHNKLRALGHIHAILVIHNDVHSNRLNPATYTILKMIGEKFAATGDGHSVWHHVIVGYSKCNAHDRSWTNQLTKKKADLQAAIRARIPSCNVDVPVVTLGGATLTNSNAQSAWLAKEKEGFDVLWNFLQEANELDCTKLQPFEGADVKWEKMVRAKDRAEAQARASLVYAVVLAKLAAFFVFLFWRAYMLPRSLAMLIATALLVYAVHALIGASSSGNETPRTPLFMATLAVLMVNVNSLADELLILVLFVYYVGPETVIYSGKHFYSVWIEPHAGPYVQIALEKAGPSCKAALETARAQLLSLTASMSQGARAGKEKAKTL